MWYQQELFDWNDPNVFIKKKKKRTPVDYDKLVELFSNGPVTFAEIEAASGVAHCGVAQVITTLSFKIPIYEVSRGVYKKYGDDDYEDGINRSNLDL